MHTRHLVCVVTAMRSADVSAPPSAGGALPSHADKARVLASLRAYQPDIVDVDVMFRVSNDRAVVWYTADGIYDPAYSFLVYGAANYPNDPYDVTWSHRIPPCGGPGIHVIKNLVIEGNNNPDGPKKGTCVMCGDDVYEKTDDNEPTPAVGVLYY
jgi:hypothetical protein